ncbi:hypothetical protein HN018_24860 (plasmid) [Lichenicola cladoniae]|uniref:Transposase n=1 Tax=Lichenicola cladoniae TaxID=1484109 RepID=A0A6M8HYJ3_9PROT|nr:hypothetical protein [Lichenicola cladoniae]NPD66825.1 hypothetical protein [Acetobacteraceae bacterium]QKE93420.1 hypothetical protein HN018_24860 [Lichenicola cladoniae]
MSGKPGYLNTRDCAARRGIEPMFANFQSRGFGLEQKQLQTPDRLSRLMLVLSLALYFAVATGQWNAVANFTVDEQIAQSSAEKPDPRPLVLVHQRTRRIVRMVTFGLPLPPPWPSG